MKNNQRHLLTVQCDSNVGDPMRAMLFFFVNQWFSNCATHLLVARSFFLMICKQFTSHVQSCVSNKLTLSIVATLAVSCQLLFLTTQQKSVYSTFMLPPPSFFSFENRVDTSAKYKSNIKFQKEICF